MSGWWTATAIQLIDGGAGIYRGGLAVTRALAGRAAAKAFFEGAEYSPKVIQQTANAADKFHAFPESVAGYATRFGKYTTEVGADGQVYEWLRMAGGIGDQEGVFEFAKDSAGVINHRFFVPGIP